MNILIATPGRLLQHMDETHTFDAASLQMLVFDEVDRMLDMGFKKSVDQILESLPTKRQTLLFSATVGKSLRDLARLNLNPNHQSIQIDNFEQHEANAGTEGGADEDGMHRNITPTKLLHYYMELKIEEKMDTLFSFLKSHTKQKIARWKSHTQREHLSSERQNMELKKEIQVICL